MLKTKSTFSMKVVILTLRSKIENSYQFPKLWGLGNITLIHKEGEEENLSNYRAITICSDRSKLFALIIQNRLNKKIYRVQI